MGTGVNKHSISLDAESSLLANYMMGDAPFSKFIQYLIKEEAKRRGLRLEVKVVKDDRA